MRTGWGTLACGIVVGAAAGFVCGHVAAWTQASARHEDGSVVTALPAAAAPFDLTTVPEVDAAPDGPVFFPQHLHASTELAQPVHADAELAGGEPAQPATLPEPAASTPLDDPEQATLRAILDAELSHLPAADRDVWLDVLEGLPPADAVGIVRLWKKFGSGPSVAESDLGQALPDLFGPASVAATPVKRGTVPAAGSQDSLREARTLVLQNLHNADTTGYRRLEPIFSVAPAANASAARPGEETVSSRMITSRIDHTAGSVAATASPLDVAIDGEGFFVVKHPTAGLLYTRCGRFSRDAAGRLALTTSHGDLPVEPEIKVPGDAKGLTVAAHGEVAVHRDAGEAEVIGNLELALFVAPAQLSATDDALFIASERSGAAQVGRPSDGSRGMLRQRCLEGSNVEVAHESALLRQIDDWLQTPEPAAR